MVDGLLSIVSFLVFPFSVFRSSPYAIRFAPCPIPPYLIPYTLYRLSSAVIRRFCVISVLFFLILIFEDLLIDRGRLRAIMGAALLLSPAVRGSALPFCRSHFFLLFPMKKKQKIPAVQIIPAAASVRCAKSSELTPWNITHILLSLVLEEDAQ